jgi:hypothetical protein
VSSKWHERNPCIYSCKEADATDNHDCHGKIGIEEVYEEAGEEKEEGKM